MGSFAFEKSGHGNQSSVAKFSWHIPLIGLTFSTLHGARDQRCSARLSWRPNGIGRENVARTEWHGRACWWSPWLLISLMSLIVHGPCMRLSNLQGPKKEWVDLLTYSC
jgi:hypothetical protein